MTADELFAAILRNDVERVRGILDAAPELLNVRDGNGDAPLHVAAESVSLEIIRLLIERGARQDARDGEGRTALEIFREAAAGTGAELREDVSAIGDILG